MYNKYGMSLGTRRWPITVYYYLLNVAVINGEIIFKENRNKTMHLKNLSMAIMEDRLKNSATLLSSKGHPPIFGRLQGN